MLDMYDKPSLGGIDNELLDEYKDWIMHRDEEAEPFLVYEDWLMHYGMPRRSGRYPWGSGENPYQHSGDFLSRISELQKQGLSEKEIAESLGLSTSQLRVQKARAKVEQRTLEVQTARGLREKGYTLQEIAKEMGYTNDSSIRALLNENTEARMNSAQTTANFLKEKVDSLGMIDVGTGVERELNISSEKLGQALYNLELDGYEVYNGRIPQATNPGKWTTIKVLCPPGTEYKDIYKAFDEGKVSSVREYTSHDDGITFSTFQYPESMDSSRLQIRYAEEGGVDRDGLIEIRRGVNDLDLGESHYAQVRILVDGTHYMKGMAIYSDDVPDGVDVVFNTNKKKGTELTSVLKKIKDDPSNPFGALIKEKGGQSYYTDSDGKQKLSLINKAREEGDWSAWKDKLPSQFLSKQNINLAKQQLGLDIAEKQDEYDTIMSLTNPTVKKYLLNTFAETCDKAAVDLQAASLPGQKYHVLIPITTMKETEVYAPKYANGTKLALIRFPHGGTFEIPILTVNNKQSDAKKLLDNAVDAIGINKTVADRLSGADFDGDAVMTIPLSSKVRITSTHALKDLEGFDPKVDYGTVEKDGSYYNSAGQKISVMKNTQKEMGVVSNLITDMTLKGATEEELARAVKHSMVVIDAEKHKLDYKTSYTENGIASLKKKYQGRYDDDGSYHEGASTLISRSKNEQSVLKRQGSPTIDPETGKNVWKVADDLTYVDKKTGKTVTRTQKSTQMAEADDALTLSSGQPMETVYGNYANTMKGMANTARKAILATEDIKYDSRAKATYINEYKSLNAKLNISLKNAPRERRAQIIANSVVKAKIQDNPDMKKAEIKKAKQQALTAARVQTGAKRENIDVTEKEWEAIQAGAISPSKLGQILDHADIDKIKSYAMPRQTSTLSAAKINKIQALIESGYTIAEIANSIGVSTSTVSKYMKGGA